MSDIFRIDIEDFNGNPVATLKNFQFFSFETKISRRGNFRLQLHDNDPARDLIKDDYILRYWYKNLQYGVDWVNPFNGIIKTPTRVWYGNGNKLAIFYGSDDNEMIDKAIVMYPTNAAQSQKTGIASDVMYEFIYENVGAGATTGNGRFVDHIMPVIINAPSPGVGPVWTGNLAHAQLTKAMQTVRDYTHEQNDRVDYQTSYSGNYTWTIDIGKIYKDKTINGLDSTTGKNAVGNVPVILSPLYKNVEQYTESVQRVQESNVVLVLGQRMGEDREYFVASSPSSVAVSPIAQRESLSQTQNQQTVADAAAAALEEKVGKFKVLIEPRFSKSFAMFRDLNPGDFFTVVSLDGVAQNKQFVELKLDVQQTLGGRTVQSITMFTEDREP